MSRKNKANQSTSRTPESTLVAPDQRDDVEINEEIAEAAEGERAEESVEDVPDLEDFAPTPTVHDIKPEPTLEITPVTIEIPTVKHTNRRPCRYPTVKLTPQQADDLHAIFLGLRETKATVNGRPVERHADAFRWLLDAAVP